MKVFWTPEAERDRADIWRHIAEDNPEAALRIDQIFSESAQRLADHPHMGRVGTIPGTREVIPHKNYRLVYEIEQDIVWILALVHVARQWPPVRNTS